MDGPLLENNGLLMHQKPFSLSECVCKHCIFSSPLHWTFWHICTTTPIFFLLPRGPATRSLKLLLFLMASCLHTTSEYCFMQVHTHTHKQNSGHCQNGVDHHLFFSSSLSSNWNLCCQTAHKVHELAGLIVPPRTCTFTS